MRRGSGETTQRFSLERSAESPHGAGAWCGGWRLRHHVWWQPGRQLEQGAQRGVGAVGVPPQRRHPDVARIAHPRRRPAVAARPRAHLVRDPFRLSLILATRSFVDPCDS